MKYAIIQYVEFDIDNEKNRLTKCFKDDQLKRHLNILELFIDENYSECYKALEKLPYDREKECDEAEYVNPFIFESVIDIMEKKIQLEKVKEYVEPSSKAKD